jgi:hypothetical protein
MGNSLKRLKLGLTKCRFVIQNAQETAGIGTHQFICSLLVKMEESSFSSVSTMDELFSRQGNLVSPLSDNI